MTYALTIIETRDVKEKKLNILKQDYLDSMKEDQSMFYKELEMLFSKIENVSKYQDVNLSND